MPFTRLRSSLPPLVHAEYFCYCDCFVSWRRWHGEWRMIHKCTLKVFNIQARRGRHKNQTHAAGLHESDRHWAGIHDDYIYVPCRGRHRYCLNWSVFSADDLFAVDPNRTSDQVNMNKSSFTCIDPAHSLEILTFRWPCTIASVLSTWFVWLVPISHEQDLQYLNELFLQMLPFEYQIFLNQNN